MTMWHVDDRFTGISLDAFIDMYFSEAFNNGVAGHIGLKERRLAEEVELPDGKVRRRVTMVPSVQLPRVVQKLVGDHEIRYHEVSVYDPATKTIAFTIEHGAQGRLDVRGTIRFLDDDGAVRRVIDGQVEAKIFGVGGVIERLIKTETVKGYDKIRSYTRRYIRDGAPK